MTYTLEDIPAKLFFKINETGELGLLSDEEISEEKLYELWNPILDHYQRCSGSTKKDNELDMYKKIQSLSCRLTFIKNAVTQLKNERDLDLESLLKGKGYRLSEKTFYQDLDRIDSLSDTIIMKIEKHSNSLNEKKGVNRHKLTFEEIMIGYLSILGFGFKDANTITLLEYLALESQVKNKVKSHGKG